MRLSLISKIEISLLLATILVTSAPLVNAQNPDFSIGANPSSRCIAVGSTTTYQITVSSTDGFSGQVLLGDDVQPDVNNGPTLGPIPSSVTLSAGQSATFNLNAITTSSTPPQVYTITIGGIAGGSNFHSTSVFLAFAPGCGAVGGTVSPASLLSLATPFIGFAVVISAMAGASVAFIRTKRKQTTTN
jgi:hypothetical protein